MMKRRRRNCPSQRDPADIGARINRFVFIILFFAICHAAEESGNSNDGSSADSTDNQSQDYDDNINQGDWYADDPYMQQIDDYVRKQMEAEWKDEMESKTETGAETEAEADSVENEDGNTQHEMVMRVVAGSFLAAALASATFCTSIILYSLRVDALMRRYLSEGRVVDGRILVSVPDIPAEMKKCMFVDKIQNDSYSMKSQNHGNFSMKIPNHDSYSMMTDDESTLIGSRSDYSGSDESEGNHVAESRNNVEEGHNRDHNIEEEECHHNIIIGHFPAPKSRAIRMQQRSDEKLTATIRRQFNSRIFRAIVEYDDITYHDEINQDSAETIQKRLLLMGEDIVGATWKASSSSLVKLYVLQKQPLSGYPCGDVQRALRWQKMLSFHVYMMFGFGLIVSGIFAAQYVLPVKWFIVYILLLVLHVPVLNCFLRSSFNKVISGRYLCNGIRKPSNAKKCPDSEQNMLTALKQGTSFSFM